MRIRFASPFAIVSLVFTTACTEWAAQPLPAGPRPAAVATARVRVTRVDGHAMELTGVVVHGDSLYGTRVYYIDDPGVVLPLSDNVTVGRDSVVGREQAAPHARVAIPVFEVRMLEARRTDPLATAAVVTLSAAAYAAFAALMISIVGTGS